MEGKEEGGWRLSLDGGDMGSEGGGSNKAGTRKEEKGMMGYLVTGT